MSALYTSDDIVHGYHILHKRSLLDVFLLAARLCVLAERRPMQVVLKKGLNTPTEIESFEVKGFKAYRAEQVGNNLPRWRIAALIDAPAIGRLYTELAQAGWGSQQVLTCINTGFNQEAEHLDTRGAYMALRPEDWFSVVQEYTTLRATMVDAVHLPDYTTQALSVNARVHWMPTTELAAFPDIPMYRVVAQFPLSCDHDRVVDTLIERVPCFDGIGPALLKVHSKDLCTPGQLQQLLFKPQPTSMSGTHVFSPWFQENVLDKLPAELRYN